MPRLKISVAIAVYNSSRYMKEQLDSITAQTRLPDEVVFCDDCSSDNTVELLENWKRTVPFEVNIFRNPHNLGCTKNFSQALEKCSGDAVIVSDCDDVWLEHRVEKCAGLFESDENLGLITGNARLIDGEGVFQNMLLDEYLTKMHVREFWRFFYPLDSPMTVWTGCTMAVRKSVLNQILPVPPQLACHDIWIFLLAPLAGKILYLDEPLIEYRLHGKNYSTAPTVSQLRSAPPQWRYFNTVIETLGTHPQLIESLIQRAENFAESQAFIRRLKNQKRHFENRAAIEKNAFSGVGKFLRELGCGGYFQHPQPIMSILYDILVGTGIKHG